MARPKRRNTPQPQQASLGAMVADYLQRRITGQPTPRWHYGPVDESLVADLKRRLANARRN